MKKGMWGVGVLALVLITGLSVFYWVQVGKKVVTASTGVNGQELPICSVQTGKKQIAYTFELSGMQTGKGQLEQMLQILSNRKSGHIFCHSVLDREQQESGNTDLSAGT